MASRIQFSASATPIASVAAGENMAVDTLAYDVQRSLGGGGSVTATFGTTTGFTTGTRTLVAATTATSLSNVTSGKFVWIKHTGYSDTGLTTPTASTLAVLAGGTKFCELPPGAGIALPIAQAATIAFTGTSSSGTIQVEVFGTT